jgi:HEAT repeat protein
MDRLTELPADELCALAARLSSNTESALSDERWAAVMELHRRGESATLRAAREWSTDESSAMRCLAADVLGQLGYEAGHPFAAESEPLLLSLLSDSAPAVVAAAIIGLAHLQRGQATTVIGLATHRDSTVRHAVAFFLSSHDDPDSIATLIALARDADRDVRSWATFSLGSQSSADGDEVRRALLERIQDEDVEVRGEALVGLAIRGARGVIPDVLRELRATGSVLAVEAARELGDPIFLPDLERLLASAKDAEDIRRAIQAIRDEQQRG